MYLELMNCWLISELLMPRHSGPACCVHRGLFVARPVSRQHILTCWDGNSYQSIERKNCLIIGNLVLLSVSISWQRIPMNFLSVYLALMIDSLGLLLGTVSWRRIPLKIQSTSQYLSLVILFCYHNDIIKWKHFPRYWPFVRGIHRSPVNSPHKGQ